MCSCVTSYKSQVGAERVESQGGKERRDYRVQRTLLPGLLRAGRPRGRLLLRGRMAAGCAMGWRLQAGLHHSTRAAAGSPTGTPILPPDLQQTQRNGRCSWGPNVTPQQSAGAWHSGGPLHPFAPPAPDPPTTHTRTQPHTHLEFKDRCHVRYACARTHADEDDTCTRACWPHSQPPAAPPAVPLQHLVTDALVQAIGSKPAASPASSAPHSA